LQPAFDCDGTSSGQRPTGKTDVSHRKKLIIGCSMLVIFGAAVMLGYFALGPFVQHEIIDSEVKTQKFVAPGLRLAVPARTQGSKMNLWGWKPAWKEPGFYSKEAELWAAQRQRAEEVAAQRQRAKEKTIELGTHWREELRKEEEMKAAAAKEELRDVIVVRKAREALGRKEKKKAEEMKKAAEKEEEMKKTAEKAVYELEKLEEELYTSLKNWARKSQTEEKKEAPEPAPEEKKEAPKPVSAEKKEAPEPAPEEKKEAPTPVSVEKKEAPEPAPEEKKEAPTPVSVEKKEAPNPVPEDIPDIISKETLAILGGPPELASGLEKEAPKQSIKETIEALDSVAVEEKPAEGASDQDPQLYRWHGQDFLFGGEGEEGGLARQDLKCCPWD